MSASTSVFAQKYGPWAVVTGASDGIGAAFAEALASARLDVVLVARRGAVLEQLAAQLQASHGVRCRVVALDLGTEGAGAHLAQATADLDVGLVVAAAGFGTAGPLLDSDAAEEAAMLRVNCGAVLEQALSFGPRLVARRRGGLVLLSSLVAFQGVARAAHYAATKAWVQTLAEGLRAEWRPHGVDVIACAPGPVRSGFAARAGMRMAQAASPADVARGTLRALGRRPTVRPGALSKLLGWSLSLLPRRARVVVIGQVMKGMT